MLPAFAFAQMTNKNLGNLKWSFRKKGETSWAKATVPGTVHTDLLANKKIVDPFFADNEKKLQWIENEDWEYETTFKVTAAELASENIDIQFDGLDTYAEVTLNGTKILSANNMFRIWKADVKKSLKVGDNKLNIMFISAVRIGKEITGKWTYDAYQKERTVTRKAQYSYGWDWGPRYATSGVWKKVQLNFWNSVTITNLKYNQKSLTDKLAELEFVADIKSTKNGNFQFKINNKLQTVAVKKGSNTITGNYKIENPKRWWTHNLGTPHLYPFSVAIVDKNKVLDTKKMNIGLRTLELVQEKDAVGKTFSIVLNGVPVFMKGASYIPPDSFLPRAKDSVYQSIIKRAKDSNMNMLRVWGGGVYGEDVFYDLCDKNGILVWQDFMFACAMYPGDQPFLDNVKQEVIDNVNRIQNHASIAVYCGNNEVDEGWKNWGWPKNYKYNVADSTKIYNDYKKVFNELIPKTLDSLLNKERNIYWPTSPYLVWKDKTSILQGDMHYWGVWIDGLPIETFEDKDHIGRLMTEYGFQGMPQMSTIKKMASGADLNIESEAMKNHQKHTSGKQMVQKYIEYDYKVPKKFEDYAFVSNINQARAIKLAMQAHRRAKPYCMGTLYWQLNDCWPVISWSSADYYGNWKALQYEVKRSYDNILISLKNEKDKYDVYIVNDEIKGLKGDLELKIYDFNSKELWKENVKADVKSNSSSVYASIDKSKLSKINLKNAVLIANYKQSNGKVITTDYFFEKPKDLELKKPTVKIKNINANTIEVSTDILAKDVFLYDSNVHFDDNYFNLLPNTKKIIKLSKPAKNIVIKTLFDTL